MSNNGIFCLEGTWCEESTPNISVLPILKILCKSSHVDFMHHSIRTTNDFEKKIKCWKNLQRQNFPILYLAFHGLENSVCIGGISYSLSDIGNLLDSSCQRSMIIFASCKTLRVSEVTLRNFFQITGVCALFGYDRMVTWMNAAACEFLTLSSLQSISLTKRGIQIIKNRLDCYEGLYRTLGFQFFTSSDFQ
jgi:hypothetical protein